MTQTVMITSNGTKVYISDRDIENAFKELVDVGFSPVEASDLALSICIARHELDNLSVTEAIYSKSDFAKELSVLASYNSRRVANV